MSRATDRSGKPVSGTVDSAVVGIVVDNVDPDELGRVKVKFPTLPEEPESFWLRQIAPMGGKERGLYALPEKDDEVLVMFMQGSQDHGVIIGQFWNGVDIPPAECKDGMPTPGDTAAQERSTDEFNDGSKDLSANDRRFWKSRSGHLIVMDDTGGAETVQIWDQTHTLALVFDSTDSRILLTNSTGDIHIRTQTDLYLEAGNDIIMTAANDMDVLVHNNLNVKVDMEIKFEAGTAAAWETGTEFKVKTGTDFKAEAGTNVTIKASVELKATAGASGTFNGGASTTIKGGMVAIN